MQSLMARRDFWAGALLAAFGIVFFIEGLNYGYGSPAAMGPGFFPRILSLALIVIGGGIIMQSRDAAGEPLPRFALRPIAFVCLALVVFAVALEPFGLLGAAVAVVGVSTIAGERFRWWEIALLAVGLSGFCALLFVYALNQPIPLLWR
jgi:hypothetical protein